MMVLSVGVCLLVGGCASLATAQADAPWIVLRMTGGLVGMDRELAVSASGAATATDRRFGRTARQQFSPDEVTTLRGQLPAATPEPPPRSTCPDCLTYHVTIRTTGADVSTWQLTDQNLPQSPAVMLVGTLAAALGRMLQ